MAAPAILRQFLTRFGRLPVSVHQRVAGSPNSACVIPVNKVSVILTIDWNDMPPSEASR
jgi:hypothetical protein